MNVFWRKEPLNALEVLLLREVLDAHGASTQRQNMSSQAVLIAHAGSGDYTKAIAAALMTLGGAHAPLAETMALLDKSHIETVVAGLLLRGEKVPGWGNSFAKGMFDPLWTRVECVLSTEFYGVYRQMLAVTGELHSRGKKIYPNPSAYTAAAAIALRLPSEFAAYLFIAGRMEGWTSLLMGKGREH